MLTCGSPTISLLLGTELDSLEFDARLIKATDLVLWWLTKPFGISQAFISDWLFVTLLKLILPVRHFERRVIDMSTVQGFLCYINLISEVKKGFFIDGITCLTN